MLSFHVDDLWRKRSHIEQIQYNCLSSREHDLEERPRKIIWAHDGITTSDSSPTLLIVLEE